ncbi:MAG TPA: hypothetical protein VG838_16705 [Opitutaceae bacterium]|nr:hypothetical protein [Opitutaceae bacterium]
MVGLLHSSPTLWGASQKKNPASKLFVTDVQGEGEINTGDKIEEISKKTVHTAQGTIIETKKAEDDAQKDKNSTSMVYSNGTGIYFDSDTRLEVKKFAQEPFAPNHTDMDVEPSISQTQAFLAHGSVGLCVSKLVAGSSMVYQTPHATINVRGRKVIIESNEKFTKVSMIEGESTVRGGAGGNIDLGGQALHAGQQAIIRPGPLGEPPQVQILAIPQSEMNPLDDKVSMACMAKKTVYFEVVDHKTGAGPTEKAEEPRGGEAPPVSAFDTDGKTGAEQEIVPVDVTPADLPVQYTVSPARLSPK